MKIIWENPNSIEINGEILKEYVTSNIIVRVWDIYGANNEMSFFIKVIHDFALMN